MTKRVCNFSPGPATLPEEVLKEAQRDLLALPGVGISILEISHRSKQFTQIIETAEANIRELLAVPDDYSVLFLQGGARMQFAMLAMNLLGGKTGDYIITGSWGKNAHGDAKDLGDLHVAHTGAETNFDRLPAAADLDLTPGAAYVHITSNETIQGVQFPTEPETGDVPLVCDASSDFLSRPLDMSRYGVLYACAQKNAGPAGVTMVIVRNDLLDRSPAMLPGMLSYKVMAEKKSLHNTPPAFPIYIVKLVTDWLKANGGLAAMDQVNRKKAKLLYDAIDNSGGFYDPHAQTDCRSVMNVTFRLPDDELSAKFLAEASVRDLTNLKGHRSVGGMRASIYNAMPTDGVELLADFMAEFRDKNTG